MSRSNPRPLGLSDEPTGARISLRECLDAALHQSEGLIDKVLNALVGKGEKVLGTHVKPNFPPPVQAGIEMLIGQRFTVKDAFNQRLRELVFQGSGTEAQAPQLMRFEDLKLFEEEDLDESIEVARALQEMGQQTDSVIAELDALMSSLLGWITVQPQINPLRPEMYARALRECIAQQIGDNDIRGAIVSHAAGRLAGLLRKLYKELNTWLKSCGVEPASTLQPGQIQNTTAKPSVAGAVGNSVARTLLTLDRLRRLLAGELDGDSSRKPQDFLHTVPASVVALQDMRQVEAMVERLENKARQAAANPDADSARKKAAARLALTDGKQLGKQLGEEVVRMMLDNLIQDERLLPQVRGQLQNLEPMLMDIAKVDGRFFSDKQHAARQFLDKVTNRSLAFAYERDDGYRPFLFSVEKSVGKLVKLTKAGTNTSQAFDNVLQGLETLWHQQDTQERARREEAARALLHAEQRNMLAQYLAQEFRTSAQDVNIPSPVVEFVCGPWAQAVAESQLRCTDGTSDPEGYHELVSELYWSVQPRVAKRNRKRLVQLIPGMLTKLRHGLQLIEFPPERITDFFTDLIGLHEAALEGGRPKPAPAPVVEAAPSQADASIDEATEDDSPMTGRAELEALYAAAREDPPVLTMIVEPDHAAQIVFDGVPQEEVPEAPPEEPAAAPEPEVKPMWIGKREAKEAGFVEEESVKSVAAAPLDAAAKPAPVVPVLTAIPIGSWVELKLEGNWVRAQLTWASPHRTLFMFVSHGGKAHSMSQRTLDKLRNQDCIRLVSDGQLVDKALDAVAQAALRNSVDAAPKAK
jgi:hypothetical protein